MSGFVGTSDNRELAKVGVKFWMIDRFTLRRGYKVRRVDTVGRL